jgi:hypothetical protein
VVPRMTARISFIFFGLFAVRLWGRRTTNIGELVGERPTAVTIFCHAPSLMSCMR